MKKLQTTLKSYLETLPKGLEVAYQTKTKKGYTIKLWWFLSDQELIDLQNRTKGNPDIVSINNDYEWESSNGARRVCQIKTTKLMKDIVLG